MSLRESVCFWWPLFNKGNFYNTQYPIINTKFLLHSIMFQRWQKPVEDQYGFCLIKKSSLLAVSTDKYLNFVSRLIRYQAGIYVDESLL